MLVHFDSTTIRPWLESDFNEIADLESISGFSAWSDKQLRESFNIHHCYSLIYREKVVGYAIFNDVVDDVELLNIVVDPSYQGLGLAKYLLQYCLNIFSNLGFSACFLEVSESNTSGIKLYSSLHFEPIGLRKNYYRHSFPYQHALTFRLFL